MRTKRRGGAGAGEVRRYHGRIDVAKNKMGGNVGHEHEASSMGGTCVD